MHCESGCRAKWRCFVYRLAPRECPECDWPRQGWADNIAELTVSHQNTHGSLQTIGSDRRDTIPLCLIPKAPTALWIDRLALGLPSCIGIRDSNFQAIGPGLCLASDVEAKRPP